MHRMSTDELATALDDATAEDVHGPATEPLPRTAAQIAREPRMIVDPWSSDLDATGACVECCGRTAHAGRCSRIGGSGYDPGLPALHATVGKRDATGDVELGIVVGHARTTTIPDMLSVEWENPTGEYGVTYEDVADLLTDVGACEHGGDPRGPNGCGEPTAPGFTRCDDHGGRSPLHVP